MLYKILVEELNSRKSVLPEINFEIVKETPLYESDSQIGIMLECSSANNKEGSISLRTTSAGFHLYDLEVFDMGTGENILVKSDSFLLEEQLAVKIDEFLKAMT